MDTDKQKLNKLQKKFKRINRRIEDIKYFLNIAKEMSEYIYIPGGYKYLFLICENHILQIEKIMSK